MALRMRMKCNWSLGNYEDALRDAQVAYALGENSLNANPYSSAK